MKNIIIDIRNIFYIFLFTLVYSYIFSGEFNFDNAMSVLLFFNFSIYLCGIIISYKFSLKYIDSFYKNLILAFLAIGIVTFAYLYTVRVGVKQEFYVEQLTRMNVIFSMYESICLILAVKYYKVNFNYKKAFVVVACISLIVSYLCTSCNYDFIVNLENKDSIVSCILKFIAITSKFYLLKIIYDIKEDISSSIFQYLSTFIIIRIIVQSSSFVIDSINSCFLIIMLIFIIEYIAHYCILKIMILEIIKNPYFNIYNNLLEKSKNLKNTSRQLSEVCEEKKTLSINYEKVIRDEEIKNELLTNISHEFRTPINVIYSAIKTQNDLFKAKGNIGDLLKYNDIIKRNCNRLIRLINNFIDSTSFKNNNFNLNVTYFNIVELTEEVVMSVRPVAKDKNLNIIFDTSDEELYAKIDGGLFDRLILNLLSNAIKYSKDKGQIYVNLFNAHDNVKIIIKDQGIGISKKKLKVIFNKFERVDQTFSRNAEGSGLGLNIVREIINIFNGKIRIKSKLGHGTTVKIILPLIRDTDKIDKESIYKNSNLNINHEHEAEIELSDIYL